MRNFLKIAILAMISLMANSVFAGEVSRALFTISVEDREPASRVDSIDPHMHQSIYFFTELSQLDGHTITHQWTYNDKVMFEKNFEVKGPRWRVWTSKTFLPEWTGTWIVNVLDTDRSVLTSKSLDYQY